MIPHPLPVAKPPAARPPATPVRTALLSLASALLCTLSVGPARADLAIGKDLLLRGEYAQARKQLEAVAQKRTPEALEAQKLLGRLEMETGRYEQAEAIGRRLMRATGSARDDGQLLVAASLEVRGKLTEARSELEALVRRNPKHVGGRAALGRLLADAGDLSGAEKVFDTFYADYKHRRLDETKAETLVALAEALRFNEDYEEANKQLGTAEKLDPSCYEAFLLRGALFGEKYAVGYAEQEYQDILKKNPQHARALVGMAHVKLEQSYDVEAALDLVKRALAVNPRLPEAFLVSAEVAIDNEDWAQAEAEVGRALAVNPKHLPARALLATSLYLKGDTAGYERERRRVLAQNKHYSRLYGTIAEFAAKHHRYQEAIALNREAVRTYAKDYKALAALGINYLRQGDEPEGLKHLKKAFDGGDQYNVRAFNTLNLFDDIFPKHYDVVQLGRFRMRLPRKEKALWSRLAPRLLEQAYQTYVKRYRFQPKGPLTIELFGNPQHYAVRTVGLPGLGALGVCFGQVITARAPRPDGRGGRFNWEQILWHELAHVFSIQLSHSRVPRWFTEGLAEVETMRARPEWERDNDQDLYAALARGQLMKVSELNMGFVRAKSTRQIVVAYYQSALTVQFLEKRFGMAKILEALRLFGQGKQTAEVIPRITGMSLEAFEAAFRAELEKRLAHQKGSWLPPDLIAGRRPGPLSADQAKELLKQLEAAAQARPNDAPTWGKLAYARLLGGSVDKAREAARKALAQSPGERTALFVLGQASLALRDAAEAKKAFEALIGQGADSYDIRMGAARAAFRLKDLRAAETHLRRAKRFDPQKGEPAARLAALLDKAGRADEALKELEHVVATDQSDLAAAKKLVEAYLAKRRYAEVLRFAPKALAIDPFDESMHLALAQAALETKQHGQALFALETALTLTPKRPAVIWVQLARVHLGRGDRGRAREAVRKALAYEPGNAEAKQLAAKTGS